MVMGKYENCYCFSIIFDNQMVHIWNVPSRKTKTRLCSINTMPVDDVLSTQGAYNDDVMTWKRFLCYQQDSGHTGSVMHMTDVYFVINPNELLNK